MPQPGLYPIRGEPASGSFFGGVLDFSNAGDIASLSNALEAGSDIVQYAATSGSIAFDNSNGVYKGHFNFTAKSSASKNPIQVEASFSNLRESVSQ